MVGNFWWVVFTYVLPHVGGALMGSPNGPYSLKLESNLKGSSGSVHRLPAMLYLRRMRGAQTSGKVSKEFLEPDTREEQPRNLPEQHGGQPEEKKPDHTANWVNNLSKTRIDVIIFCFIFFAFFGWVVFVFVRLAMQYRELTRPGLPRFKTKGFKEFLSYRFAYWFEWTEGSNAYIIVFISVLVLLLGAGAYGICVGSDMFTSVWKVFSWLVAPDAGATEKSNVGLILGGFLSICGLTIFALLLMLLQDSFNAYLESLKEGQAPVMEAGHILLIGVSEETMTIIPELCAAHEETGGTAIVILTDMMSKLEMEDKLQAADFDTLGSRIVVRHGKPHHEDDLKHVAAHTAKMVVVMPYRTHSKELRDSYVMTTLVTLRSKGWPGCGRILAVCSLVLNVKLFEQIGGSVTNILMLDQFMAKLMVQSSIECGLGQVTNEIIGFGGSELYIREVPQHMVGLPFSEAELYYPQGILAGVISGNGTKEEICRLCPDRTYTLQADDEVVVLSEDFATSKAEMQPLSVDEVPGMSLSKARRASISSTAAASQGAEQIIILGWNELIGIMMLELDPQVSPNTKILVVAPKEPEVRKQLIERTKMRWNKDFKNITSIIHFKGQLGSRVTLNDMPIPLEQATRIFILADDDAANNEFADMATITVMMQIRRLLVFRGKPRDIPVVPEMRDPLFERMCLDIKAPDFINSSGVPTQLLAMIACQPRIMTVLEEIISAHGHVRFAIRELTSYLPPGTQLPESLSFMQLSAMARACGDLVVGWSRPEEDHDHNEEATIFHHKMAQVVKDAHPESLCLAWDINPPDKLEPRAWSQNDRVAVLCLKAVEEEAPEG